MQRVRKAESHTEMQGPLKQSMQIFGSSKPYIQMVWFGE